MGVIQTGADKIYALGLAPACTLTISATAGGTTVPSPGIHSYPCDTTVQITAVPDSCYLLDRWELDGEDVGSANPCTVSMDVHHTLQAVFVEASYDLVITATPGGTTSPAPGTYSHPCGSSTQVWAIPDSGYAFDHWEIDGSWEYSSPIAVLY